MTACSVSPRALCRGAATEEIFNRFNCPLSRFLLMIRQWTAKNPAACVFTDYGGQCDWYSSEHRSRFIHTNSELATGRCVPTPVAFCSRNLIPEQVRTWTSRNKETRAVILATSKNGHHRSVCNLNFTDWTKINLDSGLQEARKQSQGCRGVGPRGMNSGQTLTS